LEKYKILISNNDITNLANVYGYTAFEHQTLNNDLDTDLMNMDISFLINIINTHFNDNIILF
jgi:hypothetical protein